MKLGEPEAFCRTLLEAPKLQTALKIGMGASVIDDLGMSRLAWVHLVNHAEVTYDIRDLLDVSMDDTLTECTMQNLYNAVEKALQAQNAPV